MNDAFEVIDSDEFRQKRGKAAELKGRADAALESGNSEKAAKLMQQAYTELMEISGNVGFLRESGEVNVPMFKEPPEN